MLEDQVQVVADENYVLVNFQDHQALERVLENVLPPSVDKSSGGLVAKLEKANKLCRQLFDAGIVLDVRVNSKTYVELGSGTTPRITAQAVFGKVGSWFKRK